MFMVSVEDSSATAQPELHRVSVSVVVPVYNNADTLAELVDRTVGVLAGLGSQGEIVLVNDGSADESWLQIQALAARHPMVVGIALMRNYGQHNAYLAGIHRARHEVVVTMDADLQNPPEEIPKLLAALVGSGQDVVYGRPVHERQARWRVLAANFVKWTLRVAMGAESAGLVSPYRIFYTRLRNGFAGYRGSFVSLDALLSWSTSRFDAIPVSHDHRRSGRSSYRFGSLARHALTMITGFSTRPLRFASFVGLAATLFGAIVLLYVVGSYAAEGRAVQGFTFLASLISILAGAQLLTIGVIGEYLALVHLRSMDRPTYVVREETPGVGQAKHSTRSSVARQ